MYKGIKSFRKTSSKIEDFNIANLRDIFKYTEAAVDERLRDDVIYNTYQKVDINYK